MYEVAVLSRIIAFIATAITPLKQKKAQPFLAVLIQVIYIVDLI